tara:strand:- start:163 stop:516 length:354 start_codon:yes stop_codon:yes gene_type:complete
MKIARCTDSQDHWYVCTRKPIICPNCKLREVRKSIFGYPSPEDFWRKKYHLQGCCPDFPRPRDWGCCNCDAAFFLEKESVVDCFLEGRAEPFEDMESAMEEAGTKVELIPKPEEIPF